MDELVITKLVEFVENISPAIWEAAQRQVGVEIFRHLLWAAAILVVGLLLFYDGFQYLSGQLETCERYDRSDWQLLKALLIVAACLVGMIVLGTLTHAIALIMNPDYYAIKNIIDLVPR